MSEVPEALYWMDRRVEELTREELIAALYDCHALLKDAEARHQSTLRMWRAFDEAKAGGSA